MIDVESGSRRRPLIVVVLLMTCATAITATGCGASKHDLAGGNPSGPLYLAATRIWDETTTTSYFHVVPSIEQGTPVDPTKALEVPGVAKLYAVADLGWFAIGGGEAPTISRYSLDRQGALVEGDRISLQSYGVKDLWDTLYVVSPTKAYYPDRAGAQLIVWNPTTMKVSGSIPLPETVRDGFLALYGYTPVMRGHRLLFSVGWVDWEESDSIRGETGLVLIDTQTDSVARFDTDARCGGITQTIVTMSGDSYFVSSALAGAAYRLGRLATEPCALRVRAAADSFDAGYLQKLGELAGGAIAGEPVAGLGEGMFLRVFDEGLATVAADSATWELTGQAAWRWSRWDVVANQLSAVGGLAPATADVLWFQVDGKVFGTETEEDYASTTLIELTAEGGPKRALTTPGFLHGVARVR